MQVKVFGGRGDGQQLEAEINDWLRRNDSNIDINHVSQSLVPDGEKGIYALISVWYNVIRKETTPI